MVCGLDMPAEGVDYNTIAIVALSFVVLVIIIYELRKPKTMGSISPHILLERLTEVQQVTESLKKQKCWNCGGPMEIKTLDLFGENVILLGCQCGATLKWSRKEGKGIKAPSWMLTGKREPPEEKPVIEKVAEKLKEG